MITLKEFLELYDNWNGITHINDNTDETVRLENGQTYWIAENSEYLDKKVIAFGLYDNEMFIRVDYKKLEIE